ncbi:3-phosphoinositide-dependent protein kinase 1-like isoform 3-T10 [Salvelinus alpinus]
MEGPQASPKLGKQPEDFKFGRILGEGSYSTVVLATEQATGKEYAMKILEKMHIRKENKAHCVTRERDIMSSLDHPFIVKLYFTFQDVKRDLKPENILLNEDMHIQITDFGTAKQLSSDSTQNRANSFVGTAEYVSPELLTQKSACKSSDLWGLGCIIYQLVAGLPPFRAGNDYLKFQKIIKLEYEFPDKFFPNAKDLVEQLLCLDPSNRLGCEEMGGYNPLRAHFFFEAVTWENLHLQTPPKLTPYLPAMAEDDEDYYGNYDDLLSQFSNMQVVQCSSIQPLFVANPSPIPNSNPAQRPNSNIEQYIHDLDNNSFELDLQFSTEVKRLLLEKQTSRNPWNQFVENNLILKMGPVDKRKGLFARRRQLLLTEGPHLYYVDPVNKVLKGEIPWSPALRPEAKNFKTFFVHTPNRTYYLMDPCGNADKWCNKIQEVWQKIYNTHFNSCM